MEKGPGIVYVKRSQRDYSLSFKLGIVGEIEHGELSLTGAARKYGIQGNNTIRRWLRKFGTFNQDNVISNCMAKSPQQPICELELENMRLRQQCKHQSGCTSNKRSALKPTEKNPEQTYACSGKTKNYIYL